MPKIGGSFTIQGTDPNFTRDQFKTLAEMKACSVCDDGHVSWCVEAEKRYEYQSSNTVDATTGKWREFKAGASYQAGNGISISTPTDGTDPVISVNFAEDNFYEGYFKVSTVDEDDVTEDVPEDATIATTFEWSTDSWDLTNNCYTKLLVHGANVAGMSSVTELQIGRVYKVMTSNMALTVDIPIIVNPNTGEGIVYFSAAERRNLGFTFAQKVTKAYIILEPEYTMTAVNSSDESKVSISYEEE